MRRYSIAAIAEALGISVQAVTERSAKGRKNRKGVQTETSWVACGKEGKAALYAFDALPNDVRAALDLAEARTERKAAIELRSALPAPAPTATSAAQAVAAAFSPPVVASELLAGVIKKGGQLRKAKTDAELDDKTRRACDAAVILCREIDGLQIALDCKVKPACTALAQGIRSGAEKTEIATALADSQPKKRKNGQTEGAVIRHLQRLHAFYLKGLQEGDAARYLAPGKREKTGHDPVHVRAFLKFWCHPNRPKVATVWRDGMVPWLAKQGLKAPSYSTACNIEKSLPVIVKYRGRMTGSAFSALKPYVSRDVSMFMANDIWVGDGHSFKAKIQSPIHGNAFIPEVTVIIDWVSRKVVGWSVALSESTIAVSDAFRDAQQRTRARPLIYYSDNGSGQTGKHIDHEITGSLARQGIGHETGRPGNPQGRGVIERWYLCIDTMTETVKNRFDAAMRDLKAIGQGLMSLPVAPAASPEPARSSMVVRTRPRIFGD